MVQKTRSRRAKQAHQCAWAATRTKELTSTLNLRIRSRRGATRAVGTVAASILTAAYHMLKNGTLYQDLGANHCDKRAQGKYVLRLVSRLKNLGFAVQIMPMAA
jgi:transposase